jgi:4-carboxymuconolactone decarboxylase
MARAFTPQLAKLVENPLYSDVWADPALSPRDRSIATVAAIIHLKIIDRSDAQSGFFSHLAF